MIYNLSDFVQSGRIDNHVPGKVSLELQIKGLARPFEFDLTGNCHADLAGRVVDFTSSGTVRSAHEELHALEMHLQCNGLAGDLTARWGSKPQRRPRKHLYLEWFTSTNGLFVIDLDRKFDLKKQDPAWEMSPEDEQVQIMANQQLMRDYVTSWIEQYSHFQGDVDPLPDTRWDIKLRAAEGAAFAFQEVSNKYRHEQFSAACVAFVMGWDKALGDIAAEEENGISFIARHHPRKSLSLFDILDEEEAIEAQWGMSHPLFQQTMEISDKLHERFYGILSGENPQHFPERHHKHLAAIFSAVRYITPNILSCILQLDEGNADSRLVSRRLSRCADQVSSALLEFGKIDIPGKKSLVGKLEELHQDILSMARQLSQPGMR